MVGLRRTENERKSGRRDGNRRILLNPSLPGSLVKEKDSSKSRTKERTFEWRKEKELLVATWPRKTLGAAVWTTAGGGGLHVHYRYRYPVPVTSLPVPIANLVKFLSCEEMNGIFRSNERNHKDQTLSRKSSASN